MHITSDLLPACVVLHEQRLKAALKEMTHSLVAPIKPDAVADVKPMQGAAEVGFGGLEQQMKMVIHEGVGMDFDEVAFDHLAKEIQEMKSVVVVSVDDLAFIAAGSDVVAAIGPWDAQRARHGVGANRTGGLMSRHKWIKM